MGLVHAEITKLVGTPTAKRKSACCCSGISG